MKHNYVILVVARWRNDTNPRILIQGPYTSKRKAQQVIASRTTKQCIWNCTLTQAIIQLKAP